jgi:hypothetical protein
MNFNIGYLGSQVTPLALGAREFSQVRILHTQRKTIKEVGLEAAIF